MWGRMTQNKPGAFPYPCSDDSRTGYLLRTYTAWEEFFNVNSLRQCAPVSDSLFANSRTLGYWKTWGPGSRRALGFGKIIIWFGLFYLFFVSIMKILETLVVL